MSKTEAVCVFAKGIICLGIMIVETICIALYNKRKTEIWDLWTVAFAVSLIGMSFGLQLPALLIQTAVTPVYSVIVNIGSVLLGCTASYLLYIGVYSAILVIARCFNIKKAGSFGTVFIALAVLFLGFYYGLELSGTLTANIDSPVISLIAKACCIPLCCIATYLVYAVIRRGISSAAGLFQRK